MTVVASDREAPGQDDQFDGWRARWSVRRRPYFAEERDPTNPIDWDRRLIAIEEPVLVLSKPGRKFVEVKGQSDIDRPVMLDYVMQITRDATRISPANGATFRPH